MVATYFVEQFLTVGDGDRGGKSVNNMSESIPKIFKWIKVFDYSCHNLTLQIVVDCDSSGAKRAIFHYNESRTNYCSVPTYSGV